MQQQSKTTAVIQIAQLEDIYKMYSKLTQYLQT